MAEGGSPPNEVQRTLPSRSIYWTRKGITHWLVDRLEEKTPTLVGIDHGFSFPLQYFEAHSLKHHWPTFLDDFQRHWPTDETSVSSVRKGLAGNGTARTGDKSWYRLTEEWAGRGIKSVFRFDFQGQVAASTHAGIPWLRFIRQELGGRVHFWPFDGWDIPHGKSAIVEVYPALWSGRFVRNDDMDEHQRDAYSVAVWMLRINRDNSLVNFLLPDLTPLEKKRAKIEGWILGVM